MLDLSLGGISGEEEKKGELTTFLNMTIFRDGLHPQVKTSRSFCRTLVTQPALTEVQIKSLCACWDKWSNPMTLIAEMVMERPDGIRLGTSLDAMECLEVVSCSLADCSCRGYRGPRLLTVCFL